MAAAEAKKKAAASAKKKAARKVVPKAKAKTEEGGAAPLPHCHHERGFQLILDDSGEPADNNRRDARRDA